MQCQMKKELENFINQRIPHRFCSFSRIMRIRFMVFTMFPLAVFFTILIAGCSDDPVIPPAENEEEIITDVTLSFISLTGGAIVAGTATDPDGDGPEDLVIDGSIVLSAGESYRMEIGLVNAIEGEDIGEEVEEEGAEHQFFFAWTEGLFSDPVGNGNIDTAGDAVNYSDTDENGLPIGLVTEWTAGAAGQSGTYRVVLKHQPESKNSSSSALTGDTDVDLTWNLSIQ